MAEGSHRLPAQTQHGEHNPYRITHCCTSQGIIGLTPTSTQQRGSTQPPGCLAMTRNDVKVGLFLTSSRSVRRDGISRDDSGAARILPVHREPTPGVQPNPAGYFIVILGQEDIYFMAKNFQKFSLPCSKLYNGCCGRNYMGRTPAGSKAAVLLWLCSHPELPPVSVFICRDPSACAAASLLKSRI